MSRDILVVDDEADIRDLVAGILEDEGYETRSAGDSDSALAQIEQRRPNLVILDIWLQGSRLDGLELLDFIRRDHPDVPVIIISGHGNVETAVSAIKRGAFNFIEKPFKTDHLLHLVQAATETIRLRRENEELRARFIPTDEMVGLSPAINSVRQIIERVAPANSRVLISGPTGSGKEVVARQIHKLSSRANGPFVVVSAANIAPERMEIELFGIERKTVGQVQSRKIGLFEQAHGGTLFLDEVGDMPIETQNKILRVLVEQMFERVDGSRKVQVDVRVMSSTTKDLRQLIEASRFREDLYHRLNVVPIQVPPLSARRDDIPLLIEHFMDRLTISGGMARREVNADVIAALQAYEWPGNVRQLRNVVERMLILAADDVLDQIGADMLPAEINGTAGAVLRGGQGEAIMSVPLREAREAFEKEYLQAQITRFGGNISRTASFVGMERSALHRKLKSLGLQTGDRRAGDDEE
ncbi:sigma-54 dependent transcriptional regulator [Iodidimonas sp. SYSU 1G8]|uniref:nitrogen assimilation response regulator NtrX n=1 Tax=Iodidimonas sp. SYSU 1G8 TaxID=3133967 RepID=UPI0031FE7BEE